ncbi:uncharacterized protein LOC125229321 isoform X1 [Leguminivora glycinivorella]|uniref:uncharacterized protein LOC125229321 isoform X1 n=1 Tax=Leguminivora glycinivorella TaxID=1035111 RepID=UPI00200FF673|nr:uncharacterized protein LOC125229321 isoform X1 [Leguminivora glycinivorella]
MKIVPQLEQDAYIGCREIVRKSLSQKLLNDTSIEIIMSSLSENTYKQYDSCLKNWLIYSNNHCINYLKPSVTDVINFLAFIYENGAQYGTINSHKSAISLLLGPAYLEDERIKRFMKGVFRLRPTAPKYDLTWDPGIVLRYLSNKGPNDSLDLENLSKKLSTLLALVTAHRVQTLTLIKLNNVSIIDNTEVLIRIPDLIKTSRLNSTQPLLKLPFFDQNPNICPARCLISYINKTRSLRSGDHDNLFISYRRPHSKLSSQRLSHWIKDTLKQSGLDTTIFGAHSTRHAATSRANSLGINLDVIRKTAGWTPSSSVFAKFYNREIAVDHKNQFAQAVLSCTSHTN